MMRGGVPSYRSFGKAPTAVDRLIEKAIPWCKMIRAEVARKTMDSGL